MFLRKITQLLTCRQAYQPKRRLPYKYGEVPDAVSWFGHHCPDHDCGAEAITERCPHCAHVAQDGTPVSAQAATLIAVRVR